jgi:hypothetical protein
VDADVRTRANVGDVGAYDGVLVGERFLPGRFDIGQLTLEAKGVSFVQLVRSV